MGMSEGFIGGPDNLAIRSEDSEAEKALYKQKRRRKGANFEATGGSVLRDRLLEKTQKVLETDEQFIPFGDLDEVLTCDAIEEELRSHGWGDFSSFVFQRAKRVFAILLVIRKMDALRDFINEGLGDEILPLADSATDRLEGDKLHSTFSKWDLDTKSHFIEFQWTVLAPVFSEGKHLKLENDTRLPFIKTEPIANGAYGGVHRVEIHNDHENFGKLGSPTSHQKGHVYALKQFTRGTADVNQRAFDQELTTMRSIRSLGHSHIIKLLATFEYKGRYSMILPLAEKNLRQFWAHTNPSSVESCWYLGQIGGLGAALAYLHNDLLTQDSRPLSCCHLDIKPENILVFQSDSGAETIWKISDFGSSYLQESRKDLPPHPGHGTYEPPECQLDLPQSQAYDIWSLGCTFLECVAWLMKGSDAIDAFAEDRLNDMEVSGNTFKGDYFFTLELDKSFEPLRATTRHAVLQWIRDLERDPNCSEAISALLSLIKNGLLQVDQSRRLKASYLSQRLELIYDTEKRSFDSRLRPLPQNKSETLVTKIDG